MQRRELYTSEPAPTGFRQYTNSHGSFILLIANMQELGLI